ncbi:MAG: hypothetical protein QOJ65_1982 [Fimbriimonadaceae bacterium]|jgi:hypothetical protein|nr:hypothetical protein [Fimbriimonadaceae bacterium]
MQQINAAAKMVVDLAYPDRLMYKQPHLVNSYLKDKELIVGWFTALCPLGAITQLDLISYVNLCINAGSEQLQSLRPLQVVNLISRRSWVYAQSA